jgi:hypothetical protein
MGVEIAEGMALVDNIVKGETVVWLGLLLCLLLIQIPGGAGGVFEEGEGGGLRLSGIFGQLPMELGLGLDGVDHSEFVTTFVALRF